jgi:hypothetical protein
MDHSARRSPQLENRYWRQGLSPESSTRSRNSTADDGQQSGIWCSNRQEVNPSVRGAYRTVDSHNLHDKSFKPSQVYRRKLGRPEPEHQERSRDSYSFDASQYKSIASQRLPAGSREIVQTRPGARVRIQIIKVDTYL